MNAAGKLQRPKAQQENERRFHNCLGGDGGAEAAGVP